MPRECDDLNGDPTPVLGGGVAAWLDSDDEHAAWEQSELQRRASETCLLTSSHDAHRPAPFITGSMNGRPTVICSGCAVDVDRGHGSWMRCSCGRVLCFKCQSQGCRCGQQIARPTIISIANALTFDIDPGDGYPSDPDVATADGPPPSATSATSRTRCMRGRTSTPRSCRQPSTVTDAGIVYSRSPTLGSGVYAAASQLIAYSVQAVLVGLVALTWCTLAIGTSFGAPWM